MIIGSSKSKDFVNIKEDLQIQQCGIDLTVGSIYKINGEGAIDFTNEKRELPQYIEIFNSEKDEFIKLEKGIYLIKVSEKLEIPNNMAGFVYPRSTLLRIGCTIHTAVHDPGYVGKPTYLLNVLNSITIYKYARFAQIIYILCNNVSGEYNGIYNEK